MIYVFLTCHSQRQKRMESGRAHYWVWHSKGWQHGTSHTVRTIVAEAVPGIVNAVTESLSGLPARQGTSTKEALANVTVESVTNVASTSNVSKQPGAEAQITTTPTGNFLNLTGPLHARRPLTLTGNIKIKGKIWAEEFIQLGFLLFKSSQPKLQAIQGEDNQITFQ